MLCTAQFSRPVQLLTQPSPFLESPTRSDLSSVFNIPEYLGSYYWASAIQIERSSFSVHSPGSVVFLLVLLLLLWLWLLVVLVVHQLKRIRWRCSRLNVPTSSTRDPNPKRRCGCRNSNQPWLACSATRTQTTKNRSVRKCTERCYNCA